MWNYSLPLKSVAARSLVSAFAIAIALAAASSSAAIYTEVGDAGQTQGTAQNTTAGGQAFQPLTDILGSLPNESDVDLYLIRITNPGSFSATTLFNTTVFDTQLFLLTLAGGPVYTNDDDPGGLTTLSTLPSGNVFGPVAPGLYLLGISMSFNDPVNSINQLLFAGGLSTDVRGPATGLVPPILGGYTNGAFADFGTYDIRLTGASSVPEPASSALLIVAAIGAFATSRRRRQASTAAA